MTDCSNGSLTIQTKIYRLWLLNKSYQEIADELEVSRFFVFDVIMEIKDKTKTHIGMIRFLESIGVLDKEKPFYLTEEAKVRLLKKREQIRKRLKPIDN